MNREIKFRAWHKSAKEMLYPENGKQSYVFCWGEEGQPVIIMQFTGLKDRNGNEIYEGDIVNMRYDESYDRPHVIVWHLNRFIAIHLKQYQRGNDYHDGKLPNAYNAIICGNIYENESLLK